MATEFHYGKSGFTGDTQDTHERTAGLHEKVVADQVELLQPLLRTDPKQSLFSGLVASLAEG